MAFKRGEQIVVTAQEAPAGRARAYGTKRYLARILRTMTIKRNEHEGRMAKGQGLACALIAAGMWGFLLGQLHVGDLQRIAESTQQGAPAADQGKPAESKPGGTRPTTPAPEPAHPDPEAQKQGAKAALPPAPAEKIAPPIKEK